MRASWLLLTVLLVATARADVGEDDGSDGDGYEHEKRGYNAGGDASFSGSTSLQEPRKRPVGSSKGRRVFEGGCETRPKKSANTVLKCNYYSGCAVNCLRDYKFPSGETKLIVTCHEGKWQVAGSKLDTIPGCEPICQPACQHNGICIAPNQCNCPENFSGPQCQFEKRPCLNQLPLPANSKRVCNSKTCTIMCIKGHEFPDGSAITNVICKDGTWTPTRPDWVTVPDCQAVCTPPCENGGSCLSFNVCQCPQDFRGPQCQYSTEACTPQKLNFNGQYKCQGNLESLTCTVSCPAGGRFQSQPTSAYTCQYATGVFVPSPTPKCIFGSTITMLPHTFWNSSDLLNQIPPGILSSQLFVKTPLAGACYTWADDHYKTFDGRVINFRSNCSYTLVRDAAYNTFSVNIERRAGFSVVKVFTQDKEYTLTKQKNDVPVLQVGSRVMAIPTQLPGVTVEFTAHLVELAFTVAGITIKWDTESFVSVDVTENLWNRTAGLCGRIDGYVENDLTSKDGSINTQLAPFLNSWVVEALGESCPMSPILRHACSTPSGLSYAEEATAVCDKLLTDARFAACRKVVDVQSYFEACRWDYCACSSTKHSDCACNSMAVFVRECGRQGITSISNWRDNKTCPMECHGGGVYMSCGPKTQESCASLVDTSPSEKKCEEGCYCPTGTVLHETQCIAREQCPCQLRGKVFQPGQTLPKDCNTCTCTGGKWECTQVNCGCRCGSIGDPHYVTFDGRRYDFMGRCSYYLVKGSNYSIEAENVACFGTISEAMNLLPSTVESPSCTKTITIRLGDQTIWLKQNREVLVNGVELLKLPSTVAGAYIHVVSSLFLLVELPNGLVVWWDGATRVYVDAPPTLRGHTKGLCGTFNMNQKDDFLTPEGDVEQNAVAFANKWKTQEKCEDASELETSHPCDVNIHKRASAERYCKQLRGTLFAGCHWLVDPEPYYHDCMFDVCSCQQKVGPCMCPILAAYAKECADRGMVIDWRNDMKECAIHCPGSQQYQVCGNICTRSCENIAHNPTCRRQCVEGCNCPEGQTLDGAGECIPVVQCPCQYKGMEFLPGHLEVQHTSAGPQLCKCVNSAWDCHPATPEDVKKYPQSSDLKDKCSAVNNEEFTTCEPVEPVTCKNMHKPPEISTAICRPGCRCRKGFVLEAHTHRCIAPIDCPCHHGGQSYAEGYSIQEECNTCKCSSGKWQCTERVCPGICTAWGDSHFKTFDDRIFDFHGSCDYVLAKGSISNYDNFDITIQNVPCSSLGVSCSKSVTLKVGSGDSQESITFTKDKPIPIVTGLERILVREAGLFVFAEVTDLQLVLQWDRGTRVYIKANPRWKNRVKGLCGNYNDNQLDDFQTPSGGISEVSPTVFGDSWRLQSYCPDSIEITDSCVKHPNRKLWAMQKCGILKSSIFQPCHSEVSLEPYLERCIFDTCACDLGGDCECLCTALAAYAQECNIRGVPIKWRSQQLCPIQCDERCASYSPCVQTCPRETCENQFIIKSLTQLCSEDSCVEGCELKPCSPGQVFNNLTSLQCVPRESCDTVCIKVGEHKFKEGEIMEQDACHTCRCSRHKKVCTGEPCPETTLPSLSTLPSSPLFPVTSTTSEPATQVMSCVSGWTPWINNVTAAKGKWHQDSWVQVPTSLRQNSLPIDVPKCDKEDMREIQCRVIGSHEAPKATGLDVVCDFEVGGLFCQGGRCPNFELRVLCNCEQTNTTTISSTRPTPRPSPCDPARPNSRNKADCHRFYHCQDMLMGPELIEKTCGPYMMYHPDKQVCDWPAAVIKDYPDCGRIPSTVKPPTSIEVPPSTPGLTSTSIPVSSEVPPALPECIDGWSNWLNTTATLIGDYESLDDHVLPCSRDLIQDIKCMAYPDYRMGTRMVAHTETGDRGLKCSPRSGFACNNNLQSSGQCHDYAIRVLCNCYGFTTTEGIIRTSSPTPYEKFTSTTEIFTSTGSSIPPEVCPPGQVWNSCGIPCNQVCLFYGYALTKSGYCPDEDACVAGCISEKLQGGCPFGSLWRDQHTCVNVGDCTCRSHKGFPIKPGVVHHENDCETCQCINNQYVCDSSSCFSTSTLPGEITFIPPSSGNLIHTTTTLPPVTETSVPPFIISSTETPPPLCDPNRYLALVQGDAPLSDSAFSASSEDSQPNHAARNARMYPKKLPGLEGVWMPALQRKDEYLQVDLGHVEPVYGVIVQGGSPPDGIVTSYKLLYSSNGRTFHYVMDADNSPQVFRGPIDGKTLQQEMFYKPVEARYIRFNPLTWKHSIGMRVEIIGCREEVTTEISPPTESTISTSTITHSTPFPEECTEEMGLNIGKMSDQQVTVSSIRNWDRVKYGPAQVRLSAPEAWVPAINDGGQWLQFDFGEPSKLTGVVTQGWKEGNAWVEAFKVQYSHDSKAWNSLLGTDSKDKIFPANFDAIDRHRNNFGRILHARYLRLIPTQWHIAIALKVEVLGCPPEFYLTIAPPTISTPVGECPSCPGVPFETSDGGTCFCDAPLWWSGEDCVNRTECPCFVDHLRYEVGAVYLSEDCENCICKLGGVAECTPKTCRKCSDGLHSEIGPGCACLCKPCPSSTILCPTSNICIDASAWCDGNEDCPDDELHCATTPGITTTVLPTLPTSLMTSTLSTAPATTICPEVKCLPGFKPVRRVQQMQEEPDTKFVKGGRGHHFRKGGRKSDSHHTLEHPSKKLDGDCDIICVSISVPTRIPLPPQCLKPKCSVGYRIVQIPSKTGQCSKYRCVPFNAVCNMTGRTFNTFDGTEFKYDVCNHILARDLKQYKWDVSISKEECVGNPTCQRHLVVTQDEHIVKLFADLDVEFDGEMYTAIEAQKIGSKYRTFSVSRLGDALLFHSHRYDFWVIWNNEANVKIGVPGKLSGLVDGLCGYFNAQQEDDKRKPNGQQARTSVEFGNSWSNTDEHACEIVPCPVHLQEKALQICSNVREEPLSHCHSVVKLDRFVSHCIETTCACLQMNGSSDTCRCQALLGLVTECHSANHSIDLDGWRTKHNCPAQCDPPLIYHDCYHRECEPSCDTLRNSTLCPSMDGACFTGCFCPDGLVRQGDTCVKPDECRDCICDGYGDPQFMTFDHTNFTFNGNCTYIASQDINPTDKHIYQVLVTNKQCSEEPASTCTEALTVHYESHTIFVGRHPGKSKLVAEIDGGPVTRFPVVKSWLRLEEMPLKQVTVFIPALQLEAVYMYHSYAFRLRLPSHTFGGRMEGLCGDCNQNSTDDFKTRNGSLTPNIDTFGLSWLVPSSKEHCITPPLEPPCLPTPPHLDKCLQLIDNPIFQKCRNVLDPAPYVAACQFDQCHSLENNTAACRDLEAYVRDCQNVGVCLEWRSEELCPFHCPTGLQYQACAPGCMPTCDTLKEIPAACPISSTEGCFCPAGQVLHGRACVDPERCQPCDTEGHYDGDTWNLDLCTNCTCTGSTRQCHTVDCPSIETVCERDMKPLEVTSYEKQCCKKYVCVPQPTEGPVSTCPTLREMHCRPDQLQKTIINHDGCPQMVCECKPCDDDMTVGVEVTELASKAPLPPGMRLVSDPAACCPSEVPVCFPEDCPPPKTCPHHYVLKEHSTKACCPTHHCEPPADVCIVDLGNGKTTTKKPHAVWNEGTCRTCECVRDAAGLLSPRCTELECPPMDSSDLEVDYVVESKLSPGKCCHHLHRTDCRVGDKVLKAGETWVEKHSDRCETFSCIPSVNSQVEKKIEVENCNRDCRLGWKYQEAEPGFGQCCGQCKQIGCLADGTLYTEGSTWHSDDNCTDFFCLWLNGTFQIDAVTVSCPEVPEELHEEFVVEQYKVPNECCKELRYKACRYQGRTYKVGESWPSPDGDPCKTVTCVQMSGGELSKTESIETCTETCSKGWQYEKRPLGSSECCGQCKQVACIYDGQTHLPGTTWHSEDNCTTFNCDEDKEGQYQVISSHRTCSPIGDCLPENIEHDGCCSTCKIPPLSQLSCRSEFLPLDDTVGLVKQSITGHGLCSNKEVAANFTKCMYGCNSPAIYNSVSASLETSCLCCQPIKHTSVQVLMHCEDGHKYEAKVSVPAECTCSSCGSTVETRRKDGLTTKG